MRLATGCSGQYNAVTSTLADLLCESPVGSGTLRLRGALSVAAPPPTYDLTLEAEQVPLTSVVRLLRQAKKQIPGDLTATGLLNAEFRATRNASDVLGDAHTASVAMDRNRRSDRRAPFVHAMEKMKLSWARFRWPWSQCVQWPSSRSGSGPFHPKTKTKEDKDQEPRGNPPADWAGRYWR